MKIIFFTLILSGLLTSSNSFAESEELIKFLSQKDESTFDYSFGHVSTANLKDTAILNDMTMIEPQPFNKLLEIDTKQSVFIPLELTNAELIALAATTSLGIVSFANDKEISDTIKSHNTVISSPIDSVGNFYGESAFAYIAAGSYFLGLVTENNKLKKAGLFIVGTEIAQTIVTLSAKGLAGRKRPYKDQGPYEFGNSGNYSFWSGHTATAFALSTVLSELYGDEYPIVPYVAYGLATLTAYARVHTNNHWASDVIVGGAIGYLVGKLAMSSFLEDGKRSGISVTPTFDLENRSFKIMVEWRPKANSKRYIFN